MKLLIRNDYPEIDKLIFCNIEDRQDVVEASISARNITKNMTRVKSSNIWSYGINVTDDEGKIGDVVAQFKDKNGGPGDIYMYFDVPVKIYRGWIGAHSKGHYFWQYIRNKYAYRKLTGDRKTKLKNGVN